VGSGAQLQPPVQSTDTGVSHRSFASSQTQVQVPHPAVVVVVGAAVVVVGAAVVVVGAAVVVVGAAVVVVVIGQHIAGFSTHACPQFTPTRNAYIGLPPASAPHSSAVMPVGRLSVQTFSIQQAPIGPRVVVVDVDVDVVVVEVVVVEEVVDVDVVVVEVVDVDVVVVGHPPPQYRSVHDPSGPQGSPSGEPVHVANTPHASLTHTQTPPLH
jgi:hypothetical protein